MPLDYWSGALEIKSVSTPQRIIAAHAAIHHNVDRVKDIIDPSASVKALKRMSDVQDVVPLIAHNAHALPVGIPLKIEATPQGLYTETYILKGSVGDNLLAVAKDLLDHGQSLGMSIGYSTQDSRHERAGTKMVRRIMDYDLKEYSYLPHQFAANPMARVLSVKAHKALSAGSDTGGGFVPQGTGAAKKGRKAGETDMNYRVVQQGGTWLVVCDADSDGDADDNQPVGSYNDEATANAVALALRKREDMYGAGDNDASDEAAVTDKMTHADADRAVKALWTQKEQDALPDSAFLYIAPGGQKDSDHRTVPRDLRDFPIRDASGALDLPHVRAAIGRIPQATGAGLDDAKKAQLQARARRMLGGGMKEGKTYVEPEEWQQGSPLALYGLGMRLLDLSETVASDLVAMRHLGEEVKAYQRIRAPRRADVQDIIAELKGVLDWAETIDRGEDSAQRMAYYRRRAESLMAV